MSSSAPASTGESRARGEARWAAGRVEAASPRVACTRTHSTLNLSARACLASSLPYSTDHKKVTQVAGLQDFVGGGGRVVTERDVLRDPEQLFRGRRVAVVGFGKAALDMTMLALNNGAQGPVHHIFRTPRWMLARKLFGASRPGSGGGCGRA